LAVCEEGERGKCIGYWGTRGKRWESGKRVGGWLMKGKEIGRLLGDHKGEGGVYVCIKTKYTLVFNYIAQAPTPAIPLKISLQNFFICKSEILGKMHTPRTSFGQIHWSWESSQ
jgi:hypothetical protein